MIDTEREPLREGTMDSKRTNDRTSSYDPDEHNKGDWLRQQISEAEWNDYQWARVQTFGQPVKFLRGKKRR
jgi:hypothetical protein